MTARSASVPIHRSGLATLKGHSVIQARSGSAALKDFGVRRKLIFFSLQLKSVLFGRLMKR